MPSLDHISQTAMLTLNTSLAHDLRHETRKSFCLLPVIQTNFLFTQLTASHGTFPVRS